MIQQLTQEAIALLKSLIATPSFSSEEGQTALLLEHWFQQHNIPYQRQQHNVWSVNTHFDANKSTLLLNSHHDTVRPNSGYTKDPFSPTVIDGKLYGLGSNDAGGCLVSLLATYTYYYNRKDLSYNLVFVGSAEEESSGPNGLNSMLPLLPSIDVAIVGEPTQMQLAIAEKGLIVYDALVHGTSSHAAHPNQDHAIYNTIPVLQWFQQTHFEKKSAVLGPVKLTVTQINAGKQHNVVPASVALVIDVRVNDQYSNQDIDAYLQAHAPCELTPRGLHLNSSSISETHPLVQAGITMGRSTYGSPTLSDQSVLSCPSLKLGPGDSKRSHTADEFIYLAEITEGIQLYIDLLDRVIVQH